VSARPIVAAACAAFSFTACSGGPTTRCDSAGVCSSARWQPVTESLNRSVLSVWGSSRCDVYAVGGGLGVAGRGALALHFDGARWREIDTGRSETLWWVWGSPASTPERPDVWMAGEKGILLRYDGRAVRVVASGTNATLYGVWGASANDVWVVGGVPGGGRIDDNDVLLRFDGQTLRRADLPKKGATIFKVWGASAAEVWLSGEGGTLWRARGSTFDDLSAALATPSNLLTVAGCAANEVYVVGGSSVYRYDGMAWGEVKSAPSGANGVSCGASGVLVVGNAGTKLRFDRAANTWTDHRRDDPWRTDFHAAWISPSGEMWAGGGNFLLPPSVGSRIGVVGYYGCAPPPSP
jgi:hypothetical protein